MVKRTGRLESTIPVWICTNFRRTLPPLIVFLTHGRKHIGENHCISSNELFTLLLPTASDDVLTWAPDYKHFSILVLRHKHVDWLILSVLFRINQSACLSSEIEIDKKFYNLGPVNTDVRTCVWHDNAHWWPGVITCFNFRLKMISKTLFSHFLDAHFDMSVYATFKLVSRVNIQIDNTVYW